MILAGTKRHTIRARRVHPDKPGNTLHLYTGLRTKFPRLLLRVKCLRVEPIEIGRDVWDNNRGPSTIRVVINGTRLSADEREALARLDGFENFTEMVDFWRGKLPFKGQIIHWGR